MEHSENPEQLAGNSNARTINTYNQKTIEYLESTITEPTESLRIWMNHALAYVPLDGKILEIGSGTGRDAAYMEKLGFTVQRTDASDGFIDLMNAQGFEATKLDVLKDELPDEQDLIIADAVLLHFDDNETSLVLRKALNALKVGGTFAATLKVGVGSEWSSYKLDSPRFFNYWQPGDFAEVLSQAGFEDYTIDVDETPSGNWLNVVARRLH